MNSSNTDLAVNTSSQVLSEYFCPVKPIHIWVLSDRTMFKITAAITIILCPVVVLLNILVILAVKMRRELKEHNSNILLASLAIADVLFGAISIPLTISLDVLLLLKRFLNPDVFCRIALLNEMTLYLGGCSSTYHLAVIAWERYVAIRKWTEYKVIVTRGRVKKYARIAWLVAVFVSIPPRVMKLEFVEIPYKYLMIVSLVGVIPGAVSIILIGYFYILVYLGVRKRNIDTITEVRSLIKAKLATKVAKTTAILTGAVFISFIPSIIYLFFGEAYPVLRRSSYFRWSMMLAHLNSVFNPVLYCYRDRRCREAMLEMLKMRKPAASVQKNVRRRIGSIQLLEDPQENHGKPRLRSCGSIRNLPNTDHKKTNGKVKRERRASAPSSDTSRVVCVDVHQPTIMRTKPEKQVKGTRHHYRELIRSKSLDERALVRMIGSQRQCRQEATRRAKTAPSMARSMKISECELDGFERKPGRKVESSVTTKGDQSHLEDISSKLQASRFRASLKRQASSPIPKSSRHREIIRSKSLAGHECELVSMSGSQTKCQGQKTIPGPKRALSTSRNKEMATCKLTGQTGHTRKPHLNVNSGVTTKGSQSHDLEDNTKQPHASRFQAPLHTQSSSLRLKGSQHQYREIIRLESLDEHDPFEMEMQSAQMSVGSDTKTEDIVTNFISKKDSARW